MRIFIGLKLPPKTLMQIKEIQDKLPVFQGRKTELKNLHLTLKFLGDVKQDKIQEIKNRLKNVEFEGFESSIEDMGIFDKKKGKGILWLQITGCESLQKKIDDALEGIYTKENRFMSHLTIARIKNLGENKKKFIEELKKIHLPKTFFINENFYLIKSKLKKEGPEYSLLEEYSCVKK